MPTTVNSDNGSLHTGSIRLAVGDKVRIDGEGKDRTVTYVMGSDHNGWHACFKGQGSVPTGSVTWESVAANAGDREAWRHVTDGSETLSRAVGVERTGLRESSGRFRAAGGSEESASAPLRNSRLIGVDFAGPREAGKQRQKILAVEAQRIGEHKYEIRGDGFNERLVREKAPGWAAIELSEALEGDYHAGLVALDFPFSIPAPLIADPDFASRAKRSTPFSNWLAFNGFVAAKSPLACSHDLMPFERWRDKQYLQLRATDKAAGAQPALKDSYQVLFNMTLLGAALLSRLRVTGDYRVDPFDADSGQAGTIIEIYPGVAMRRLGKTDYKRDPKGAIDTILTFCAESGIEIGVDPQVRARCETYGMDRSSPDPDGSDALIALCIGILYQQGQCERVLEIEDDPRVAVEGVIWAPFRPGLRSD